MTASGKGQGNQGQPKVQRRAGRRLSTRVTAVNTLISLIGFVIMGIVLGVVNYRQSIAGEEQKMGVYLANSLSSADNKLKDMARVSMMCYSDEKTQDILKNYGIDTYGEQLASEKYLNALYTSLITIREDIDGIYIFNSDSLIMANDTLNPARKLDYDIQNFIRKMEMWEGQEGQINGCVMRLGIQPEFMRFYMPLLKKPTKEYLPVSGKGSEGVFAKQADRAHCFNRPGGGDAGGTGGISGW